MKVALAILLSVGGMCCTGLFGFGLGAGAAAQACGCDASR